MAWHNKYSFVDTSFISWVDSLHWCTKKINSYADKSLRFYINGDISGGKNYSIIEWWLTSKSHMIPIILSLWCLPNENFIILPSTSKDFTSLFLLFVEIFYYLKFYLIQANTITLTVTVSVMVYKHAMVWFLNRWLSDFVCSQLLVLGGFSFHIKLDGEIQAGQFPPWWIHRISSEIWNYKLS